MLEGVLIAESIRPGAELDDLDVFVRSLSRQVILEPAEWQPGVWTLLSFVSDGDPDELAAKLADALDRPGWYADFRTEGTTWVVYPGRVFRYARGDEAARAEAVGHGRALGVPDVQLDWPR